MGDVTLKEIRLKRGLSQAELAERVGVEERTIRRWENGECQIPTRRLASVVRELQISYDKLMFAIGEMEALGASQEM